jgi:2-polyprenyl-3-methyl-5-hydroxy-6-metoxy-1,4-benzoquinol methylase
MESEKRIQEEQYLYPYHYIPEWGKNGFSQTQHWSWGFRYLGGMKVVLDELEKLSFESLIDVGCGDGRFLREVEKRYPEKDILGVDYSDRAIKLARTMNPEIPFEVRNIIDEPLEHTFEVATLIEVLEHIPPDQVDQFINQVHAALRPHGCLILTVPHVNKPVSNKHYQHFDADGLRSVLDPYFQNMKFIRFDSHSKVLSALQYFLGGDGDNFIITNSKLNNLFINIYFDNFLYIKDDKKCGRICVICKGVKN